MVSTNLSSSPHRRKRPRIRVERLPPRNQRSLDELKRITFSAFAIIIQKAIDAPSLKQCQGELEGLYRIIDSSIGTPINDPKCALSMARELVGAIKNVEDAAEQLEGMLVARKSFRRVAQKMATRIAKE